MARTHYVRNPEGIWINIQPFIEKATCFAKNGYYTNAPYGSPDWVEFWEEERRRILNGVTFGGVKITGDYYHYLNYCPINKTVSKSGGKVAKKGLGFPDFWDGDYNFFWSREIARNGVLTPQGVSDVEVERIMSLPQEEKDAIVKKYYDKLQLYFNPVVSIKEGGVAIDNLLGGRDLIVLKKRRAGFEQPNSETVMTPTGMKTMGELKVGDYVLTPTGKAKILEYFPQGKKDVYEVVLQDGRRVRCGINHLWEIVDRRKNKRIVNTSFFLDKKLHYGKKGKECHQYFIRQTKPTIFSFNSEPLPIDPYLLGLYLGDGSGTQNSILFSTEDSFLVEECAKRLKKYGMIIKFKAGVQYIWKTEKHSCNPIGRALKDLGLRVHSGNKFIPECYKYASVEERFELVRGLMDSDGTSSPNGAARYTSTSERLIDDLCFVLRSLGIRCKKSNVRPNSGFCSTPTWVISIVTDLKIFNLPRKQNNIRTDRKYDFSKVAIREVNKLDYEEESSCILIDSDEHLYLTTDFVVTHNSLKNSSIAAANFFHRRGSYTMFMAYEKKYLYPKGIFNMTMNYINFINENTAFSAPSDYVRKQDHIRNSYITYKNGIEIEAGYKSEVQAISFKNNPQAGVGKDGYDIIGEEVGVWGVPGGLIETRASMYPSVTDGIYRTGMMTFFGTANDADDVSFDFKEMFNNPLRYEFLSFYDVWGGVPDKIEGFFFPANMNMPGFTDSIGNSDLKGAKEFELLERKKLEVVGSSTSEIQRHIREFPLTSAEALTTLKRNSFPVEELQRQLDIVKSKNLYKIKGKAVNLFYDGVGVRAEIKTTGVNPIYSLNELPTDLSGEIIIYEHPEPNAPKGLYKIGYDPVMQDSGTSLAAIIVYKTVLVGSLTHSMIVAEFIGRRDDPEDMDKIACMLAEYYNTTIMFENMVPTVKNYFRRIRKLHLLAAQPDAVISKNIKKSKVARVYGCHMNDTLKEAGERYVKEWLNTVLDYDENNSPVRTIDKIYSIRFLEEAINYNRKGNFDLMSAFFMAMFQYQEGLLGEVKEIKKISRIEQQLIERYL